MDSKAIIRKLEEHDKKFEEHDDRFDVIVKKLLDHDEQFISIRQEIGELRQEMRQGQDEMLTILRRLDQERVATFNWIKRVEEKCDKNTDDIDEMKGYLGLG